MNEITRIHLGRQPFTIAVDAHKQLQEYLDAIRKVVGKSHKEVIKEVELRMAELLIERGITGDKAILPEDVTYLQAQLGKPGDFTGEEGGDHEDEGQQADDQNAPKRLYRDEKNGMLAGVSAGLAAYFNVDAVIVRLIFILLTVAWGWGILLYIILWIIVPPAKTTSERLRMRGKAVTVASLTSVVNREVTAAAGRAGKAGKAVNDIVSLFFKGVLAAIGIIVMTAATLALLGVGVGAVYLARHHEHIVQGIMAFPVGTNETLLAVMGLVAAAIISVWFLLIGSAMTRRKWSLPGWATASLIGIFLLVLATSAATLPDSLNSVEKRYESSQQTISREVTSFEKVRFVGGADVTYKESDEYKIDVTYFGRLDPEKLLTSVDNGTLTIDSQNFVHSPDKCDTFCLDWNDTPEMTIYSPKASQLH